MSALPPDVIGNVVGTQLATSWFTSAFATVELILAVKYFSSYRKDNIWIRAFVALVLGVDFFSALTVFFAVYGDCVTRWGDPVQLLVTHWPIIAHIAALGVSSVLVEGFLIFRFLRVTKNWFITVLLAMLAAGVAVTSVLFVRAILVYKAVEQRDLLTNYIIAYLSMIMSTDVLIAAALSAELLRMQTSFQSTQSLIKRIIFAAIATGSVTCLFAVATLIAALVNNQSNLSTGLAYILGQTYGITLLFNLINRKHLRMGISYVNSSISSHRNDTRLPHVPFGDVDIHMQRVVHIDPPSFNQQSHVSKGSGEMSKLPL